MVKFKDMVETVDIDTVILNADNPRILKDDKFKKLVKSVKEFPQMLEIRPIVVNSEMVVLGGNMRLQACKKAGLKQVTIIKADNLTEEQQKEFIIKDNVGFGEWDWDMIANEWNTDEVEEWGLDVPLFDDSAIDELDDGEEIEIPQSVQLEPPKEYVLIMFEPNSVEWEDFKQKMKLKLVRRGGYKKGSAFDALSTERIFNIDDFKDRYDNSSTK